MSDRDRQQNESRGSRMGGLVGAIVLIAIGIVFLLQNMGYSLPGNWWAIFLFIPAAYSLIGAWKSYRDAGGEITMAAVGPLIGGLVLLALGLVFLFNLDFNWGVLLPGVLIVLGFLALARWYWRR
jgi:LiaF transmembrane domain